MNELENLKIEKLEIITHKSEHGELCFDNYEEWIKTFNDLQEVINPLSVNSENYKDAKKVRAFLNNKVKELTSLKTSFIKDYVNDYETKSKEITKLIKSVSDNVNEKVNEYEKTCGLAKPNLITITFKTYDQKLAEKLLAQGEKLGIKGEIK